MTRNPCRDLPSILEPGYGFIRVAHIGDYSPLEAARVLGVSRGTIWNMIRDGKLPSYAPTRPSGARRIRVEAVQALRRGEAPFEAVRLADGAFAACALPRCGGHNA